MTDTPSCVTCRRAIPARLGAAFVGKAGICLYCQKKEPIPLEWARERLALIENQRAQMAHTPRQPPEQQSPRITCQCGLDVAASGIMTHYATALHKSRMAGNLSPMMTCQDCGALHKNNPGARKQHRRSARHLRGILSTAEQAAHAIAVELPLD